MKYLVLVFVWTVWCALHSALIARWVTDRLERRWGPAWRYYRLYYNAFAAMTLVPVLVFTHRVSEAPIFRWDGWLRVPQGLLLLAAVLLLVAGGRRYDLLQVLGIRQIRGENSCTTITADCRLDTAGVLAVVRHPWYTAGILIVWARHLDTAAILTNLVINVYFVVGALLEEHKLLAQFEETYREYQRRVSIFVPIKWLAEKLFQSNNGPGK